MKTVHRRLRVNRVDRDRRAGQHEQISGAIAENLIGDVQLLI